MRDGWQTKKLGELANIELGKTPSRADSTFWDEKRVTGNVWLSIADLLNSQDNNIADSKEYISHKGAALCKIVHKGTLLVSFKLTLGRLAFAGRDLYTNEAIAALTLFDEQVLSKEYLFWFLQFFDWVKAAENDVKLKGMTLNKAKLKELDIHYPTSLPEQQRIVRVLDEASASISKAKDNAEKNLKNARDLFKSYLSSAFANPGDRWEVKNLGDVCNVIAGQSPEGKYYNSIGEGLPFYQGKKEFTEKFLGEPTTWTTSITKVSQKDDILMSVRAPVGPVNVSTGRICIGRGLAAMRASSVIDKDYLFYFLLNYEREIIGHTGAVFDSINKTQIENIPLPLPSVPEQLVIVAELHELSVETKQLVAIYQKKLAALDQLKQALLQQAFNGEL